MQEKCVNHLKFTRKLERGTNIEIVIVLLAIPNNGASLNTPCDRNNIAFCFQNKFTFILCSMKTSNLKI